MVRGRNFRVGAPSTALGMVDDGEKSVNPYLGTPAKGNKEPPKSKGLVGQEVYLLVRLRDRSRDRSVEEARRYCFGTGGE